MTVFVFNPNSSSGFSRQNNQHIFKSKLGQLFDEFGVRPGEGSLGTSTNTVNRA